MYKYIQIFKYTHKRTHAHTHARIHISGKVSFLSN